MQEYPQQAQVSSQPQANQPGRRLPGALDPRNYDPRRAVDPAQMQQQMQKLARAQAVARAKAQATSTVFLATVVSLATSAFGVVAALAWNQAIQDNLKSVTSSSLFAKLTQAQRELVYAVIVTFIAVIVILALSRIAARLAKKSAIDVAEAEQGSV
jgi:cytochrome c oxidase subunit IV